MVFDFRVVVRSIDHAPQPKLDLQKLFHQILFFSPQKCRLRASRLLILGSHGTSDNVNPGTKMVCRLQCPVIMMTLATVGLRRFKAKWHSLLDLV